MTDPKKQAEAAPASDQGLSALFRMTKPCPFCGSEVGLVGGGASNYVECDSDDCGAFGPTKSTISEAVSAWNSASSPEATTVLASGWCVLVAPDKLLVVRESDVGGGPVLFESEGEALNEARLRPEPCRVVRVQVSEVPS